MDNDICPTCNEIIDIEFNDFSMGFVDRYTAHCRCTREREAEEIANRKGGYTDYYVAPTLADVLNKDPSRGVVVDGDANDSHVAQGENNDDL